MSVRFGLAMFSAALLFAACSSGGGHASPTTTVVTPKGEHASQAAANAALLRLADLPVGTTSPQPPASTSARTTCGSSNPLVKPHFQAVAIYRLPRSLTTLGEIVGILSPGGAAQIMRNVRAEYDCPVATESAHPDRQWSVAKLNVPSIAPGQLSYGLQHSYASQQSPSVTTTTETDDLLFLPVNSSSVLLLSASATSPNGSRVVDLAAFEDFARKAWTRAESTLGR